MRSRHMDPVFFLPRRISGHAATKARLLWRNSISVVHGEAA